MEKVSAITLSVLAGALSAFATFPETLPGRDTVAATGDEFTDSLAMRLDSISNAMDKATHQLGEVVVTARESRSVTSSSLINRQAMAHLQPSSLTDIMSLLPGHVSSDPRLGEANLINLRQAVNPSSADYATSSLGTSFILDGVPVNTSAEMQYTPDSNYSGRLSTGKGVDMRSFSTDDIESIEVVRGIPSAEYGEVTSGVVNIRRKRGVSGLEARFKADMQSQLFYVGKGVGIGGDNTLNFSADYLDSRIDPRNSRDNFRRVNVSARGSFSFKSSRFATTLSTTLGYSGTFERDKNDPDLTINNTVDYYTQDRNTLRWTGALNLRSLGGRFFNDLTVTTGLSYSDEHLVQNKTVASSRVYPLPVSLLPGESNVGFLPMLYLADYDVYGKPVTAYAKASARFRYNAAGTSSILKAGAEWNFSKNYGRGAVYDLTRPLTAGNTSRPRPFRDVPSMNQLSAYAEQTTDIMFLEQTLQIQAGVRQTILLGLPGNYYLSGRPYFDPRVNLKYTSSPVNILSEGVTFEVAGGFGWHTKMPVAAYLYPDFKYTDFVQLNYFHNNEKYRVMNIRTYVDDMANPSLTAARNFKWEVRGDIFCNGNRLSVTYFRENMTDAFRMAPELRLYQYKNYDASGFNPDASGSAPDPSLLPYTTEERLNLISRPSNSSRIKKEGVEFTFSSRRIPRIRTRLTVTGAWFRTTLSNSEPLWYKPSIIVNNKELQYVGLYNDPDGSVYQSFNTNFIFDTDIPRLGLNFSLTLENMWFTSSRQLFRDGVPMGYVGLDGNFIPWSPEAEADPYIGQLVRRYAASAFDDLRVPAASTFNFKATKKLLRNRLMVALYVNRIVSITPDYELHGITRRRYTSPYFGMELNLKL